MKLPVLAGSGNAGLSGWREGLAINRDAYAGIAYTQRIAYHVGEQPEAHYTSQICHLLTPVTL